MVRCSLADRPVDREAVLLVCHTVHDGAHQSGPVCGAEHEPSIEHGRVRGVDDHQLPTATGRGRGRRAGQQDVAIDEQLVHGAVAHEDVGCDRAAGDQQRERARGEVQRCDVNTTGREIHDIDVQRAGRAVAVLRRDAVGQVWVLEQQRPAVS
jgi:hypothetical protein